MDQPLRIIKVPFSLKMFHLMNINRNQTLEKSKKRVFIRVVLIYKKVLKTDPRIDCVSVGRKKEGG
jgi:hypothetical protein